MKLNSLIFPFENFIHLFHLPGARTSSKPGNQSFGELLTLKSYVYDTSEYANMKCRIAIELLASKCELHIIAL